MDVFILHVKKKVHEVKNIKQKYILFYYLVIKKKRWCFRITDINDLLLLCGTV